MGRPAKQDERLSKAQVISTALRLLDENGPSGLSFRSLATELGVTPMAVAHHIGSRQDLLKRLVEQVFDGVERAQDTHTPQQRLRCLLCQYCERVLAHPNVAMLVLVDQSFMTESLTQLTKQIRSNVKSIAGTKDANTVLDIVVDYTHGFAIAASSAKGKKRPTVRGFQRGLDWILKRL